MKSARLLSIAYNSYMKPKSHEARATISGFHMFDCTLEWTCVDVCM